jgi:hypothetical protein
VYRRHPQYAAAARREEPQRSAERRNEIADTVHQILSNPAGAIQQLNNIIASARMTILTLPVATSVPGSGLHDEK